MPIRLILALVMLLAVITSAGAFGQTGTDAVPDPPTRLESSFTARAGEPLRLFGYDLFQGPGERNLPALGLAQDDHILGVGDRLRITLSGQTSGTSVHAVESDGRLLVDALEPIAAAGRSLGDVRAELRDALAAAHIETRVHVSLAEARRISVLVIGEVARQGRHDLSAFATVLDALFAAGGVSRTGSLRNIRLYEPGDTVGRSVDLYGLLGGTGTGGDLRIRDGSRLLVPPVGAAVAVAGAVKRPAIFELPAGGGARPAAEILDLAGGPLQPGRPRSVRLRFGPDGAESALPVGGSRGLSLEDGDILLYGRDRGDRSRIVQLGGAVRDPGPRPLPDDGRLSDVLRPEDLADGAYRPLAVLARRDPATGLRTFLALSLGPGTAGWDRPIAADDVLYVLGDADIAFLAGRDVLKRLAGPHHTLVAGEDPQSPDAPADRTVTESPENADQDACPGLAALSRTLAADPDGILASGPLALAARAMEGPALPCPALFVTAPDLLPFVLTHAVLLRRGVQRPGPYPTADPADVESLVAAAGGRTGVVARMATVGVVDAVAPASELVGAVLTPGVRPLADAPTLRRLLGDGTILAADAYALLGVIERFEPETASLRLIPFVPIHVLEGSSDRVLRDRDRVRILTRGEASSPLDPAAQSIAGPPDAVTPPGDVALLAIIRDRPAEIHGAVMLPGRYAVAEPVALRHLVAAAGGFAHAADRNAMELTSLIDEPNGPGAAAESPRPRLLPAGTDGLAQPIGPGDSLRVPHRTALRAPGYVTVSGEALRPGRYDIGEGERLSSVIARAGGLSAEAYPDGAIFTREAARRAEEEGWRRAASELDRGLALALLRKDPPPADRIALVRELADSMRTVQAAGRITVQADPALLALRPEEDILLEAGDRIHFPKRPLSVTVTGEVLSPASLKFVSGKSVRDYLREAGGTTRYADKDRTFVIYPDGSSAPWRGDHARHRLDVVPPGATIVVPRDPEPFDFLPTAQSIATILGQLALTAASVAAITDD